jgi:hypothetical protein
MSEHTEIPCIERLRNARRLAWRAGFEEAMRTVEINLALLLILAQQQVDEAEPGSPRQQRARQRLNDLRKAFTVITANPVDRIDSKTRLATALRAALEQALDAAHVPESSNRPERGMEGSEDLIRAVLMGLPLWPNDWGKEVAAAAWVLTEGGQHRCFRARAPGRLVTSVPPHGVVGKHPMPRAGRAA